jgi:hypothetical protein
VWFMRSDRPGFTKLAEEPNGMKFASELWRYQLVTEFLSGLDHEGKTLGAPLLDTRLHAMRSAGVDDQRSSWNPGARRAEPPEGIQNADPPHAEVLEQGGVAYDHADQGVADGEHRQFFQHAWHCFAVQHVQLQGRLKIRQRGLDRPAPAGEFGEVSHTVDLRIEQRGHEGNLTGPEARCADTISDLSEYQGRWQGCQGLTGEPRGTGLRFQPRDELVMDA